MTLIAESQRFEFNSLLRHQPKAEKRGFSSMQKPDVFRF